MNDSTTPKPATKRYRTLLGVAGLCLLGFLATAGVKSSRDLIGVRAHAAHLEREIEASKQRIKVLAHSVELIENDPLTLERLAREELGMVRPGDLVIVLPEDKAAKSPRPAAVTPPASP